MNCSRPTFRRTLSLVAAVAVAGACAPGSLEAQDADATPEERCERARQFLEDDGLTAVSEPDTIDDWRSGRTLPGCRVTAAGTTTSELADEAERFYRRLRAAGWTRTPDPADAPNEASLRFRSNETDCLFNVYPQGLVGSPAERRVNTAVTPGPGEDRYNVLVLCMPAVEASRSGQP